MTAAGTAHDDVCMRLFAAGLLAAGLKDEAAAVYYSLLQGGADKGQQVCIVVMPMFTTHLSGTMHTPHPARERPAKWWQQQS